MRPPPPTSTLFPYTTLFRSDVAQRILHRVQPSSGNAKRLAEVAEVVIVALRSDRIEQRTDGVGKRSEEHTSELQSLAYLVCRLLLEKKKTKHERRRHQLRNA